MLCDLKKIGRCLLPTEDQMHISHKMIIANDVRNNQISFDLFTIKIDLIAKRHLPISSYILWQKETIKYVMSRTEQWSSLKIYYENLSEDFLSNFHDEINSYYQFVNCFGHFIRFCVHGDEEMMFVRFFVQIRDVLNMLNSKQLEYWTP